MLRVCELFAGAGGFSLGLKQAGHKIVWVNDNDRDAIKTYLHNFKPDYPVIQSDCWVALQEDLPECDIVVGGPPCLAFTHANANRGLHDPRSALYKAMVLALEKTAAPFFMMENVQGLESTDDGKAIEQVLGDFSKAEQGYKVQYAIINAKNLGIAQNRARCIIFGVRSDIGIEVPTLEKPVKAMPYRTLRIDDPNVTKKTLRDAIGDLPEEADGSIPNHVGSKCVVKISNRQGNRATDWDKVAPAMMGRGSGGGGPLIPPHPNQKRRLSCRECARIQTFPDDFFFYGANSSVYRQVGNAVPVKMAYHLGLWLNDIEQKYLIWKDDNHVENNSSSS